MPDERDCARTVFAGLELDARPARLTDHVDGRFVGQANWSSTRVPIAGGRSQRMHIPRRDRFCVRRRPLVAK